MKRITSDGLISKLITIISSSLVPTVLNLLLVIRWGNDKCSDPKEWNNFCALTALIGVIASLVVVVVIHMILPLVKPFRAYKKYEGRWLQIIPDLKHRPYSIIDFKFNRRLYRYELHGVNFYEDISGGLNFDAYKFLEKNSKDGFYYITNQTVEFKNGLGKIAFVQNQYDDLIRAEGYFFDSSNDAYSKKYNTIIIKCDKCFYERLGHQYKYIKLKKIPPIELMKLSEFFAKTEIERFAKYRINDKDGEQVLE